MKMTSEQQIDQLRTALRTLLDCANAIVGANPRDPLAAEAFQMFNDARLDAREALRKTHS
jgi:hypothetical protein